MSKQKCCDDVENIDEKSAASKEAEEQGLVHLGFGRYGPKRGDPATHVSKDGELKPVSDKEPEVDGGEPEDKPFGGDTGKDADFQGEPEEKPSTELGENWMKEIMKVSNIKSV